MRRSSLYLALERFDMMIPSIAFVVCRLARNRAAGLTSGQGYRFTGRAEPIAKRAH
jgi:hypothetical protein